MPFSIVRDDLSKVRADAVVVAANERLQITGGVGAVVADAAGFQLLQDACDSIGFCPTGQAVVTPGFNLLARFVVHAVGPVWDGGAQGEEALLRSAYDNALRCAADVGARSIALPLISAGTYGFPPELALSIATDAIRAFLNENDVEVMLVLYDRAALVAGLSAYGQVAAYIDDRYVRERQPHWPAAPGAARAPQPPMPGGARAAGTGSGGAATSTKPKPKPSGGLGSLISSVTARFRSDEKDAAYRAGAAELPGADERTTLDALGADRDDLAAAEDFESFDGAASYGDFGRADAAPSFSAPFLAPSAVEGAADASVAAGIQPVEREAAGREPLLHEKTPQLSELLDSLDEPFSTTLLALIDTRGMSDVDVYKRANMSRQLFSKIRSDAAYRPTKKTVLALSVALRLSLRETEDLLRRAGFALSHSSKADVIVEYFIRSGSYDIFEINETLYAFDQPLL